MAPCAFCNRSFARRYASLGLHKIISIDSYSDALKRHWITCKVRLERAIAVPVMPGQSRGRKLRSCDRCRLLKQACTSSEPCTSCSKRKLLCTYKRQAHQSSESRYDALRNSRMDSEPTFPPNDLAVHNVRSDHMEICVDFPTSTVVASSPGGTNTAFDTIGWDTPWNILDEYTLAAALLCRPTVINVSFLVQFPFLENFTKSFGLLDSFECGGRERVSSPSMTQDGNQRSIDWLPPRHDGNSLSTSCAMAIGSTMMNSRHEDDYQDILRVTHSIVAEIRKTAIGGAHRGMDPLTWSPSVEARCYEFYHPSNLQKYLSLFWSCWYPNWPTIHRPTFNVTRRSPKLVAAMAIVGACVSSDQTESALARTWFEAIELTIFNDDVFFEDDPWLAWEMRDNQDDQQRYLDILQAAYCVCLFQTWEGSKKSRKRVLQLRFNTMLQVRDSDAIRTVLTNSL